jgi:hypothetical protein
MKVTVKHTSKRGKTYKRKRSIYHQPLPSELLPLKQGVQAIS